MIDLKNVTKIFSDGKEQITAVDDVSLSIKEGEIYGIIGYSGAGKSTLVRTLNGLEKPSSGEVIIDGNNLSALKGGDLRKERQKIGMIFQHFNLLWSRTVKENIQFPLEIAGVPKNEQEEKASELIQLVGLEGREDAYPAQLSGGQKQRVGIARALANDPKVLLCDEATSALDPQTTDDVLDLLVDINKRLNLTIVIITHEMHVIRKICHRVAVMEGGKVVEEGNVLDVFKNPQKEITKRFIRQDTDPDSEDTDEILAQLIKQYPNGRIVHLTFHGTGAQAPIISTISRKFEVDVNIIQGSIQATQETPIGSLYVQLLGEETALQQAIAEFNRMQVETEVIEHVADN
ncbi:methionine ABC transporter ATP-binding protein [Atopococcus tabaci]|uniref:methionine ABC transporter ATP-binding protein n=1 Tax=Atopococcus tabaci TaxID=269774 RepID=UPI00240A46E8|nr:methionine ABC transporter ATP-binding protein [Atopococcus tabaci]